MKYAKAFSGWRNTLKRIVVECYALQDANQDANQEQSDDKYRGASK